MISRHMVILLATLTTSALGCGHAPPPPATTTAAATTTTTHDHGGWWCTEHGVPEEVCGLCDHKLGTDMKAKGDWCKEHDRPDSQCFACHPEKQAEFAAQYEAKYGKQPPQPSDNPVGETPKS